MVKVVDPDLDDEKLVGSNAPQRNWRGICIAFLVIAIVLSLIVTSVVLLTPPDDGPRVKGRLFEIADIFSEDFQPYNFNGTWISADSLLYMDHLGGLSILNASNLSTTTIMSEQIFRSLSPQTFQISPDHNYLLLAQTGKPLYRHSYLAQYTVYDISTGQSYPLTIVPEVDDQHPYLQAVEWSPRQRGHGIIIVHNSDIYYREEPRSNQAHRITRTAVPGVISNGVPDWLYEEEILKSNKAFWLSKDGHLLVYATFNDTLVNEMRFPWYGNPGDDQMYPEIKSIRYPKPGTNNPEVTLRVADLIDPNNIGTKVVRPPEGIGPKFELYFTDVTWVSLTEISVVWMNRLQNISMVTICKSPTWICHETHKVTGEDRGWVDITTAPIFSPDALSYVSLAPVRDGPAGYYRHIINVNIARKRILPLTHGRFDVEKILAWDHKNDWIYYLGIPEQKPSERHLYRITSIPPRVGAPLKAPFCLTCVKNNQFALRAPPTANYYDVSGRGGEASVVWGNKRRNEWIRDNNDLIATDRYYDNNYIQTAQTARGKKRKKRGPLAPSPCLYHYAYFSSNSKYYVLECLGPNVPTSQLYLAAQTQPKFLMHLQNNTELKERLAEMALPQIKTFPVQISGGYYAQVRLFLPPGLREDEITTYPLLVQVYGGPASQLVTDRWRISWNTYLASSKNYIVAQIDGRGSSGQGYRLLHEVYYRLGTVEVADQLEVTEYLRDTLHFIDNHRVAVWGWSYGGYVATLALASETNVFQCGIAVAPVTNWKLYASAYTERHMGYPNATANYKGYDEADVTKKVLGLKDRMFYLMHGTADDNVHLQHSMALVRAMANEHISFRQQIYPDENHSLAGVRNHLYKSMDQFLEDCYAKLVPPNLKSGLRDDDYTDDV